MLCSKCGIHLSLFRVHHVQVFMGLLLEGAVLI